MRIIIYCVIFLFPLYIKSQVSTEWIVRYDGPIMYDDSPCSIGIDNFGNVYVTGQSQGISTGFDFVTIKYNPSGILQWEARYNGPANSNDEPRAMKVDESGNVYVTGFTYGIGTDADYTTIKYNINGEEQWVARYNGPANLDDEGNSILVDSSGNVYVTGNSRGIGTNYDYATIKYSSKGKMLWSARYDGPSHFVDFSLSMALDQSANVYVTGSSFGPGSREDYATLKYDQNGNMIWAARFNGPGNNTDVAGSIAIGMEGNVYVTGRAFYDSLSGTNMTTIKYSSDGQQQWNARYFRQGNYSDYVYAMVLDSYENIYITGGSSGGGSGSWDCATIKYNNSGMMQWAQRYSGGVGISLALDDNSDIYVGGASVGANWDFALIKYNSNGTQQWIENYSGPGENSDGITSIVTDSYKNIYVTGNIWDSSLNFCTIKYSQVVNILNLSSIEPVNFILHQNYPNPFNPTTNLEFGISNFGFVTLKVYNISGKEVATLVNDELKPGTYKYKFDASDLPSGVYFYKLSTQGFKETKRMIFMK